MGHLRIDHAAWSSDWPLQSRHSARRLVLSGGESPADALGHPPVWVITLNWNGMAWLGDCLSSILAMDYPAFEVLVVDNGSADDSVELLRRDFPTVNVLELDRNYGYSGGFNRGLDFARSRGASYFLIINNDTVIDRGALMALVDTATRRERVGFVTGKVYFLDYPDVLQTVGKKEHPVRWDGDHIGLDEHDDGQYDDEVERVFLDQVYILLPAALYDEIGGYDPQLFLQCEEFDWQVRAKRRGWRLYYTPKAKLWHRASMSMGGRGNPVGTYFERRSGMVVMARHAGLRRFLRYYAWSGSSSVRSVLGGLRPARWSSLKLRFSLFLGFVGGTLWLVHRQPPRRPPWMIRMMAR